MYTRNHRMMVRKTTDECRPFTFNMTLLIIVTHKITYPKQRKQQCNYAFRCGTATTHVHNLYYVFLSAICSGIWPTPPSSEPPHEPNNCKTPESLSYISAADTTCRHIVIQICVMVTKHIHVFNIIDYIMAVQVIGGHWFRYVSKAGMWLPIGD